MWYLRHLRAAYYWCIPTPHLPSSMPGQAASIHQLMESEFQVIHHHDTRHDLRRNCTVLYSTVYGGVDEDCTV
ncbi:hypothetical protein BJV78DRAFT_855585 [Lactifluus subvellereus]|nr:hypothetical protein BJV78DRAFT_855585 [Lactifluus subvellereus]